MCHLQTDDLWLMLWCLVLCAVQCSVIPPPILFSVSKPDRPSKQNHTLVLLQSAWDEYKARALPRNACQIAVGIGCGTAEIAWPVSVAKNLIGVLCQCWLLQNVKHLSAKQNRQTGSCLSGYNIKQATCDDRTDASCYCRQLLLHRKCYSRFKVFCFLSKNTNTSHTTAYSSLKVLVKGVEMM